MSDFANTAPYGRGVCHVCVRPFNLKKDGTVRSHGDGVRFPPMNCSGSGERPRATVEGGEQDMDEIEFVKFVEENDHEGETWTFWVQVTANEGELAKLEDLINEYEAAQGSDSEYQLDIMTQLGEHDVDVLVKHGGQGYMDYHHKVVGTLTVPDDLLVDGEYGKTLDALYKGGIKKLFKGA